MTTTNGAPAATPSSRNRAQACRPAIDLGPGPGGPDDQHQRQQQRHPERRAEASGEARARAAPSRRCRARARTGPAPPRSSRPTGGTAGPASRYAADRQRRERPDVLLEGERQAGQRPGHDDPASAAARVVPGQRLDDAEREEDREPGRVRLREDRRGVDGGDHQERQQANGHGATRRVRPYSSTRPEHPHARHQHADRLDGQRRTGRRSRRTGRRCRACSSCRSRGTAGRRHGPGCRDRRSTPRRSGRSSIARPRRTTAKIARAATATATISVRVTGLTAGLSIGNGGRPGLGGSRSGQHERARGKGGLRGAGGSQSSSEADGRATGAAESARPASSTGSMRGTQQRVPFVASIASESPGPGKKGRRPPRRRPNVDCTLQRFSESIIPSALACWRSSARGTGWTYAS